MGYLLAGEVRLKNKSVATLRECLCQSLWTLESPILISHYNNKKNSNTFFSSLSIV